MQFLYLHQECRPSSNLRLVQPDRSVLFQPGSFRFHQNQAPSDQLVQVASVCRLLMLCSYRRLVRLVSQAVCHLEAPHHQNQEVSDRPDQAALDHWVQIQEQPVVFWDQSEE